MWVDIYWCVAALRGEEGSPNNFPASLHPLFSFYLPSPPHSPHGEKERKSKNKSFESGWDWVKRRRSRKGPKGDVGLKTSQSKIKEIIAIAGI